LTINKTLKKERKARKTGETTRLPRPRIRGRQSGRFTMFEKEKPLFSENIGGNAVAPSMYSWARRTSFPPNFACFAFPRSGRIWLNPFGIRFVLHKTLHDSILNQFRDFNCSF